MTYSQLVTQILHPKNTNLGNVGVALLAAARKS